MKLHTRVTGKQVSSDTARLKQKKRFYVITKNITKKSRNKRSPTNLQQHLSKLFTLSFIRHEISASIRCKKRIFTLNFRDNFVRISHTLLHSFDPVSKNRYVNRVKPKVSRTWAIHNNSFGSNKSLPRFAIETRIYNTTIAFFFFFFTRWFN